MASFIERAKSEAKRARTEALEEREERERAKLQKELERKRLEERNQRLFEEGREFLEELVREKLEMVREGVWFGGKVEEGKNEFPFNTPFMELSYSWKAIIGKTIAADFDHGIQAHSIPCLGYKRMTLTVTVDWDHFKIDELDGLKELVIEGSFSSYGEDKIIETEKTIIDLSFKDVGSQLEEAIIRDCKAKAKAGLIPISESDVIMQDTRRAEAFERELPQK